MYYRKKPVVIEAITFDELVQFGRDNGANIVNDMPWSFTYKGQSITHENDTCYLIPTPEGTMKFTPDDMLITGVKGEIYPCKKDIFESTYQPESNANLSFGDAIQALKQGKRIARAGWNGKGLFIFMQVPANIDISIVPKMQSLPQSVKDCFVGRASTVSDLESQEKTQSINYKNQMAIVYPDNTISGWVPSASDTLEEDWQILD
jgi:hypothetical protein